MRYHVLSPGDCMPQARFLAADGRAITTGCFGGRALLMVFMDPLQPLDPDMLASAQALCKAARAQLAVVIPGPAPDLIPETALHDPDLSASRSFGALPVGASDPRHFRALAVLFDPMQRLITGIRLRETSDLAPLRAHLSAPQPILSTPAPVLILPRVFSTELCAELIARHKAQARALSGVMRVANGVTVGVMDPDFKRRRDHLVDDPALIAHIQNRIRGAVLPELRKAYGFTATRMERYLVGSYAASDHGHFSPHRDNTTPGTAHRRFAISINLNDDFEGGAVSFPEFGPEAIKLAAGTALVFGCGLLHTVAPVTQGARYAFLPFVYDEEGARIREANLARVEATV